jgi:hypothetical protein
MSGEKTGRGAQAFAARCFVMGCPRDKQNVPIEADHATP